MPIQNPGIINTARNNPAIPADQYKAPETKPVTTQVDNATGTVEGRLNNLTKAGSEYTNLAKAGAVRSANSRGLVNSTIAAGAGEEAAIKSALPIAQQDAEQFNKTRTNNQNVQNQFSENRQKTNLGMEAAAQGSTLATQENTAATNNQIRRDVSSSGLTQAEQAQLNALNIRRDVSSAGLNQQTAAFQSNLTQAENAQLNALTMKRDQGLSTLTQAEQAQLSALTIKQQAAQSGNVINQQNNQSGNVINQQINQAGLTAIENAQLNDLQMKRDSGLATLTAAENVQLNDLTMKRDAALSTQTMTQAAQGSTLAMAQAAQANQLAINRDALSAGLNQQLAILENTLTQSNMKLDAGLKLTLEQTLQDGRFSDQVKMNALDTISNIMLNTAAQVSTISNGTGTPEAQAAAITALRANAQAEIATYQTLLKNSVNWTWPTVPGTPALGTSAPGTPAPGTPVRPVGGPGGVVGGSWP